MGTRARSIFLTIVVTSRCPRGGHAGRRRRNRRRAGRNVHRHLRERTAVRDADVHRDRSRARLRRAGRDVQRGDECLRIRCSPNATAGVATYSRRRRRPRGHADRRGAAAHPTIAGPLTADGERGRRLRGRGRPRAPSVRASSSAAIWPRSCARPTTRSWSRVIGIGVPRCRSVTRRGRGLVGDAGAGVRGVVVAPVADDVTVAFATEDGTATAGSDYVGAVGHGDDPGRARVAPSPSSRCGCAAIASIEPKENLRVRLHDPVGAVFGRRASAPGASSTTTPSPGPTLDRRRQRGRGRTGDRRRRGSRSRCPQPATQPVVVPLLDRRRHRGRRRRTTARRSSTTGSSPRARPRRPCRSRRCCRTASPRQPSRSRCTCVGATGAVIGRANGVGTIIDDD